MKLVVFLFFFTIGAMAQDYRMGKVSKAELEEKMHPSDTSAPAAVLYKKSDVYFTVNNEGYWNVVTETEMRIKIYKKEGYKYGNFEKMYWAGSHSDRLVFSNDASYNLVDGKIVKTRVKGESEFSEKKAKNVKSKKLTFPDVKEGTIIEFKYTHTTYNTIELADYYFQEEIPVNFAYYRMATPDPFDYNRTLTGYLQPMRSDETINHTGGSYKEHRVTFKVNDAPALKDEDYVNNINNYRSCIKHELASKTASNGAVENFATNWEAVSKKIYDNDDFGRELEKTNYFEEDLTPVLQGKNLPEEKIKAIFEFVRDRMAWNEYTGYSCEDGVKTAYKNRTGNVADINLMLTAMLRYAGVKANPILVSTRSHGIAMFPSRTGFNYVIAGVETDKDVILLDATSKNSQPNILPARALNWMGRIIRADGTTATVDLMPKSNSLEQINLMATIEPTGVVNGQLKDIYHDHNAFAFRENYLGIKTENYLERLETKYKGLEIDDYKLSNGSDLEKPVSETYSFTHNNLTEIIGDRMYFSPLLFFVVNKNPFTQEKREYPVDFVFPHQDKYVISITIPEGYMIESVPKPAQITMEENIGTFKYNITSVGNQVQLAVIYEINYPIVGSNYYTTLKTFFAQMIEKQKEKIVLKKA
ncbi:MAG: DUF3857 domain-containing protein [Flavobacterium sp.]|nr:DUF3857 domain-containing protein [Flavobacterium sp.]